MDSKDKLNIQTVIKVIGYIVLFFAFYLVLMRVDTYLRQKAIDDCAKISRYETSEKTASFSYPVLDIYNKCLVDKGVKK